MAYIIPLTHLGGNHGTCMMTIVSYTEEATFDNPAYIRSTSSFEQITITISIPFLGQSHICARKPKLQESP